MGFETWIKACSLHNECTGCMTVYIRNSIVARQNITFGVLQKYLKSTSRKKGSSECDASDQLTILLGYRYTRKSDRKPLLACTTTGKGMGMGVTTMKHETKYCC